MGGTHYKGAIQPIEFILANNIGFIEGTVIKYLYRWKDKGGVEDLEKAKHYIDLLIEHMTKSSSEGDVQIETNFDFPQQKEGLEI